MRSCRVALLVTLLATWMTAALADDATEKRRMEYAAKCGDYDDTFRLAASLQPRDGIGEFEAYLLAQAYFFSHINLCGGSEMPKQQGDKWVAETRVGYFGRPGPKIIVERPSGITYAEKFPKVENPQKYLKFIRKK